MATSKTSRLKRLISDHTVTVPGVFNPIVAMMAERLGFEAIYVSGAGQQRRWRLERSGGELTNHDQPALVGGRVVSGPGAAARRRHCARRGARTRAQY